MGDWFVNLGGLLEASESDWMAPWIAIHDAMYSNKIFGHYQTWLRASSAYGGTILPGYTLKLSRYWRRSGLPNFNWQTDPLDADKIRLGSSLILAQIL